MTDETRQMIIKLGHLGYPPEKCAHILELTGDEIGAFIAKMKDPSTEEAQAFQVGIDQADFEIDTKLYALAKSGDMKALETLKERTRRMGRKC